MSKQSYFAQYVSPNIVIVPTISFLPPHEEDKGGPSTNISCYEQNSGNNTIITPTTSKSEQNITKKVDCKVAGTSTLDLSSAHRQDISLTVEREKNMSQSMQELSSNKYKSRNSLVDFTGFNIHKRDNSLTKRRDSVHKQCKTEHSIVKSTDKKENNEYLGSNHTKTIKSSREVSKSEEILNSSCKENTKGITNTESRQDKTDMEDKMKKYFNQLWERNIEKLKDKTDNGKQNTDLKNIRTKQTCEDSRRVPSQYNGKQNTDLKSLRTKQICEDSRRVPTPFNGKQNTDLKTLRTKHICEDSRRLPSPFNGKQNTDLKNLRKKQICEDSRRVPSQFKSSKPNLKMAVKQTATKSLKTKIKDTSSSEHSSRSKSESKPSLQSIRGREEYLSPQSIRYKNFQHFIRHNENGDDNKTDTVRKKENSHISTKLLKSNKSTIYHAEPKKLVERKLNVKSDLLKSVVTQVNKTVPNNYIQTQGDLRSILSRKRPRTECFSNSQKILKNKMDMNDLVITVKQDVKMEPKIAMLPPKNKPKPKKCKKIKLVINIECPTSDSDDSDHMSNVNECCTSPQDLSFLDDFDVDEIVDSLNTNHSQPEGSTHVPEVAHDKNKTNEKDQIVNNRETKERTKGRLIKATNVKISKINKVKNNNHEKLPDKNHSWDATELKTESSNSNKAESNIKKPNDKNKGSSSAAIKKPLQIVNETTNKKVDDKNNKKPVTEPKSNQPKKVSRTPEGRIRKPLPTAKNVFNKKAKSVKQSLINNTKIVDSIEASLENMFNDAKRSDGQLNITNKQSNVQQIITYEDTIEASLDNMFNSVKNKPVLNLDNKIINKSQHIKQEEILSTIQEITKVLVEPNDQKKNPQTNMITIIDANEQIKTEQDDLKNIEALVLSDNLQNSNNTNQIDIRTISEINENVKEKGGCGESIITNNCSKNNTKNVERMCNVKTNIKNINNNKEHLKKSSHVTESPVMINENKVVSETNLELLNISNKKKHGIEEHLQESNTVIKVQKTPINKSKVPDNIDQSINKTVEKSCENTCQETKTNVVKEMKTEIDCESSNTFDKNVNGITEPLISPINTENEQSCAKTDISISNKSDVIMKENAIPKENLTNQSKNSKETSINNIKEKSNIKNNEKHTNVSNKTSSETLRGDDMHDNCFGAITNNNEQSTLNVIISNDKVEINEKTECTSEKSLKIKNNTPHTLNKNAETQQSSGKCEATTKKSMPPVDIKNNSMAVEKRLLKTGAKSNNENHEKSTEKLTDNGPKPHLVDDDLSKTKNSLMQKDPEKNNKSNQNHEKNTNTKQADSNDKTASNDTEKRQDTKSDKLPLENNTFVKKIEERMLNYLGRQYTVTSLVHRGRFSTIYKCKDQKGENHAIKVMNATLRNTGMSIERILTEVHKYRPIRSSSILGLINGFGVQGYWCLLTDYYTKNLEETLIEKGSFNIELVQILARQLIDAVDMLTNNNIIHSDIKPHHILLNYNRLKLCGFDRANNSDDIIITPKTGTVNYRAPEIILGFSEDYKIDVWSTALVILEMATNTKLFPGHYNNDILYKQICTLGSFDWDMMEYCRYKHLHFKGTSFVRQIGFNKTVMVHAFRRNNRLYNNLYKSAHSNRWGNIDSKVEKLYKLLEQMLVLDPRHRLPIRFAATSEFVQEMFT